MKKASIFILLLLILPFISAVQLDMKSNYTQGETLIAQVSGNFLTQIQQQNIFLYNGHVRISFIPTVQRAGDTFYLYGQLYGKTPGNYSLVISGVSYSESGKTSTSDIAQNFTITNDSADFSVSPGFVESDNPFMISAQNLVDNSIVVSSLLENTTITASSNSGFFASLFGTGSASSTTPLTPTATTQITSGQTRQIPFSVNASNQDQLIFAVLQTNNTLYEIPVFVPSNQTQQTILPSPLVFQPLQEVFSMSTNSNVSSFLSLYNSGQNQTVSLSVSDSLQPYVTVPTQVNLGTNSSALIPINITSNSIENIIEGQITATSPNSTAYFALTLNFSNGYVAPANGTTLFQTCSQLSGIFCSDNETCSGQTQHAEDGICCIGSCQPIPNNSAATIIGWTIAAIVILFVLFFFIRRYRKAKRPFNLLDFARKKK